jgi:hypothetical protein
MTKILLYGYCVGVFSSRKIQKHLVEDVAFRVLAAGNQPDFRTISDFRKQHLKALEDLFQQMLRLTLETGTMKLGRVALDGSKFKANASKHKAMSYARMGETEKRLREEVRKLLSQAEATDKEEDKRYGRDRRGDELPEELKRRETRIARIREAKQALEERAREQAKSEGKDPEKAQPTAKSQYSFTDPESRILKGLDGFVQGYNTQIAVEPAFQLIVGQQVTQAANDKEQLVPLVEKIEEQSGQKPQGVVADSGYCSEENLKYLNKRRIEGFVATEKQLLRTVARGDDEGPPSLNVRLPVAVVIRVLGRMPVVTLLPENSGGTEEEQHLDNPNQDYSLQLIHHITHYMPCRSLVLAGHGLRPHWPITFPFNALKSCSKYSTTGAKNCGLQYLALG